MDAVLRRPYTQRPFDSWGYCWILQVSAPYFGEGVMRYLGPRWPNFL